MHKSDYNELHHKVITIKDQHYFRGLRDTYVLLILLLQKCLSVAKAMDPSATASSEKVKFLIHADLLYEIVLFGLADKDTKVSQSSKLVHISP